MPRFVVLLRGVNVGKAKRVPMTDFEALLSGIGCTSATTLLNSGNAVVEAPPQASATLAGKGVTTRNWATVPKLQALASGSAA